MPFIKILGERNKSDELILLKMIAETPYILLK
jgi:hypothetical protein